MSQLLDESKKEIIHLVISAAQDAYSIDVSDKKDTLYSALTSSKNTEHGDFALPCFALVQSLKGSPVAIAIQLGLALAKRLETNETVGKVEVVGPYLNFFLSMKPLAKIIDLILRVEYLSPKSSEGKMKVMIEYSQPNTHKAFHVGHMRNAALGDCVVRLYKQMGYPVVAANYFGDEGNHVARCLWLVKKGLEEKTVDLAKVPEKSRGEWLGDMYSKAVEMLSLDTLTSLPYGAYVAAKVVAIADHPNPSAPKNLHKVTLDVGSKGTKEVICGGVGYEVDDIIAYAPIGVRIKGKGVVEVKDSFGFGSEGFIASKKELGIEETKPAKDAKEGGDQKGKGGGKGGQQQGGKGGQQQGGKGGQQGGKGGQQQQQGGKGGDKGQQGGKGGQEKGGQQQGGKGGDKGQQQGGKGEKGGQQQGGKGGDKGQQGGKGGDKGQQGGKGGKPDEKDQKDGQGKGGKGGKGGQQGGGKDGKDGKDGGKKRDEEKGGDKKAKYDDEIYILDAEKYEVKLGELLVEIGRLPDAKLTEPTVTQEYNKRTAEVKEILKNMEAGEKNICKLWEETKQWSLKEFKSIYSWLDCTFDHDFFESECGHDSLELVREYHKKGVFVESEGAVGARLDKFGLGFCMLIKSNGSGLYATKDLTLARKKFEKWGIDKSIYIVDAAQTHHFKQVFKCLELMGYEKAKHCFHLPYGQVVLPSGKMSSRAGNVIMFSELVALLRKQIMEEYLKKYVGEWDEKEIENALHVVSVATIKFGMLNHDTDRDIVFKLNEWTAKGGKNGPYLVYTYARIRSILREVPKAVGAQINFSLLSTERDVIALMHDFWRVVEGAMTKYNPSALCDYLFSLSKSFSSWYETPGNNIKHERNPDLQRTRLAFIAALGEVLRTGMSLLGIKTLERM